MNYKKSDYAINKFSDGIAYRLATGETIVVTYEDMKIENPNMTPEEFQELKNFSDEDYRASYNNDHKETRKITQCDDLSEMEQDTFKSPEDEIITKELQEKVNNAIASLTETQQRRVRLFYFEGLSSREIAKIEGLHYRTIQDSLSGAQNKMKKFLDSTVQNPSQKAYK